MINHTQKTSELHKQAQELFERAYKLETEELPQTRLRERQASEEAFKNHRDAGLICEKTGYNGKARSLFEKARIAVVKRNTADAEGLELQSKIASLRAKALKLQAEIFRLRAEESEY